MKLIYSVNEDYFAVIDSEEKAYWLGFIAADGCLPPLRDGPPRRMTLKLSAKDTAHLEAFRDAIEYTGPIYRNRSVCKERAQCNGVAQVTLSIGRRRFAAHLVDRGICPRKTSEFAAAPTNGVPDDLLRHFWRGYFDGDGSLTVSSRKSRPGPPEWAASLVGTRPVLEAYAAFLYDGAGVSARVNKSRSIWVVSVGGTNPIQAAVRLLYAGATVFLPRKKALAEVILSLDPYRFQTLTVGGEVLGIAGAAHKLGVHQNTLRNRLHAGLSPEAAVSAKHIPSYAKADRKG